MNEDAQKKGCGVCRISTVVWDDLGRPCSSESWHKVLLLPDDYTVVEWGSPGARLPNDDYVALYIEHAGIPVVEEIANMPEVRLFYRAEYHDQARTVFLDRIEIWAWQCVHGWKQVK